MFYATTIILAIFLAMESVLPRIVLAYININLVLIFWLIIGIILLFMEKKDAG